MRSHLIIPITCALLCLLSGLAAADINPDPFGTEKSMPLKPVLNLSLSLSNQPAMRSGNTANDPCGEAMPDDSLNPAPGQKLCGLLDVINIVLCKNPKTREVWANSRAQAAQVGVNQANYLPSASLSASESRSKTGTTPGMDKSNIGVTLSYLLYDFGVRAANLETARQLLAAASATQDSTVQTIFLAAVQAFYQTQAKLVALEATTESERAAKGSFAAAEARYIAGSATLSDKLQAQTAYSQATLNRITADGNLKTTQGTLANFMGMDANQNVPLVTSNAIAMPADFEADINALIEFRHPMGQ